MNEENIERNSLQAWVLAARPKTLTAALIPIFVACAMAWLDGTFQMLPAIVCVAFASLMQIASNLINDLYDYLKGTDGEDRLGPLRATAQGWITPAAMRMGIAVTVVLACAAGCILIAQSGLWLMAVGAACVVFAFLYTTVLSYYGLGDLLVLVFFGLVPVTATYYLQAGNITTEVWLCAFACGIVIDTLLVLNNFRDRDTDKQAGKRTLIVLAGETFGKYFYLALGIAACIMSAALAFFGMIAAALLPLLYLPLHIKTWRTMIGLWQGRGLNAVLGMTSRNMFLYGMLLTVGILLSAIVTV